MTEMTDYKLGDKVRITNRVNKYYGCVGVVTGLGCHNLGWYVTFDDGITTYIPFGIEDA